MHKLFGKMKKCLLSACLSASLWFGSTAMAALPEIISLQDVKPGMWGTGYTVIDSSGAIRPFDVEVVGILGDNSKMSSKRILVNLYGDVIDETGGAISGMSGSPIYFGGRLAGALSAGYKDMYPTQRIMLTPIEDMLKIWQYPDTLNRTKFPQLDLRKMKAEREKFQAAEAEKEAARKAEAEAADTTAAGTGEPEAENAGSEADADESEANSVAADDESEANSAAAADDAAADIQADTEEKNTYFASGFGSRGMKLLQEGMSRLGMKLDYGNVWDAGASVMQARTDEVLEPGSPVGVALSVGEFYFRAMGTITAVKEKKR